ncbi:hypothetical protein GCM10022215_03700 [Nocardioides fonticola]|uniref:Calcium-binding protein n=1 Tax=Nocardioides fonticola TaxID=450363 RepID=A0ABP7XAH7_9ACTN
MPHLLGNSILALALGWATWTGAAVPTAAAPTDSAADTTCDGRAATIVATADDQTIVGTDGPDVISSAGFRRVTIDPGGGDDVVCNYLTGFVMYREFGRVLASEGDDTIHVSASIRAAGGPGADTLVGTGAKVQLSGGDGPDHLYLGQPDPGAAPPTSASFSTADGGPGDDVITMTDNLSTTGAGGDGNDQLIVQGTGSDTTAAPGLGDDTVTASPGSGAILGYSGPEPLDFQVADGVVDGAGHDTFSGVTAFSGGTGADIFRGTDNPEIWIDHDIPTTHRGADVIDGAGGDDTLSTVFGTIDAGAGADTVTVRAGTARGGEGDDTLAIDQSGTAIGGPGDDSIRANWSGVEYTRFDGAASFVERGGAGDDVLYPASAYDAGGDGQEDRCTSGERCRTRVAGGDGRDTVSITGKGRATIDLAAGSVLYGNGRGRMTSIEVARGNEWADRLLGTSGADELIGGFGNDVLIGRGGPDRLIGDQDRDIAYGGPGRDVCRAEVRRSC